MAFNIDNYGKWAGAGSVGAGLAGLFGNKNPADAAGRYLSQIPGSAGKYLDPYINAGRNALDISQGELGNLIRDPSGRLNQIGAGFQQSPGFQFALQQALQGAGHASAAGGMAGSPQHEQQNMGLATNLANQDYYNFMDRALGLHGQGLQGMQGIAGMGLSAGKSLSDLIAQALAQRGAYEYAGNASQNAGLGGLISNIGRGIGLFGAFS